VPIAHPTSVFELPPAERADIQDLLLQARVALHDLLAPDGYLLGWNQGALHPLCMSFRDSTRAAV
jgi:diadenosine tetraphosphate (Ap4A) HIT family hydrolase